MRTSVHVSARTFLVPIAATGSVGAARESPSLPSPPVVDVGEVHPSRWGLLQVNLRPRVGVALPPWPRKTMRRCSRSTGARSASRNPDKPYFSRDVKLSKLDLVRYYLSVAAGARRRHSRSARRAQALRRRRRGRAVLSEARARQSARLAAHRHALVSVGTHRRGSRGRRRGRARVDRQPRLHRAASARRARRRSRSSRRAAHRSRSRARASRGTTCAAWRWRSKALLEELGLRGWPKTSGSRGMHVNVRIEPRWTFTEVRRAALAFSREIERRAPTLATSKWWKEERHGVFLDYNQNAKDRTTCSAYSVRPLPDARVSAPLDWDEVPDCEPADFTVLTVPARFAAIGDPHARDGRRRRLARAAARARRARRGRGPRRRAVAAALPQDGRRGAARRAVAREGAAAQKRRQAAPRDEDAADRRRELAEQGRGARGARALEGASTPRRRRSSPSTTCSSTRCAAGRRRGRAFA